jgi:hypothetical protein
VDRLDHVGQADALGPVGQVALDGQLLGPRTMFSIMAPDAKSLKYMISLSPFW